MANLKNITELPVAESAEGLNLIVNDNGSAKQIAASAVGAQADWAVTDNTNPSFIKNKPTLPPAPAQTNWDEQDTTSLAYMQNKPFYDTREYGNITVTFDGDITGKEAIAGPVNDDGSITYIVKVSNKIPTKEELIGGTASGVQNGETMTTEITSDMIEVIDGNGNLDITQMCVVVPNEFAIDDTHTLSRGIWGVCVMQDGVATTYASELSWYGVTNGELKQIEEKYIPKEELDLDIVITQVEDAEGNAADPTWAVNSINTFEKIKNKIFNGIHPNCKCRVKLCTPTADTIVTIESYNSMNACWGIAGESEEAIVFGAPGLNFNPIVAQANNNTIVHVAV